MNDRSDKQILRRLFDSPYLALAILSKDFCLLEVNDTFARAAGKSVDHFGGKNLFTIYPEKDLPLFERAVRTGECVRSSTEIYAQDFGGGLSYWEWTLDPILDESGNTELLLLTLMEVTKRRKAELALSDTREHLEHLMGSIASGFYALDRNWRFTYLNRAAQEHTRSIVRKDLIGESIWEAFPLLKGTIAEEKFRATMEQGTTEHFEFHSPYTNKWTDVYVYPSHSGITIFFNDITARKEAELELARSEEKFATIFHANPTIMSIRCLRTDRYVEVNDAWVKAIGYSREEVIGKTPKEMQLPVTPGLPTLSDVFKTPAFPFENHPRVFRTKSGGVRDGIMSASLIELNGEPYALVSTTDVTEQRAMEREMQRLDRLNVIGQMASGVGHEIRNPLTVVRGFLQLLRGKYPDAERHFTIMISELDRANAIITEFLALAKTKPDQQVIGNINEIIDRIFPMLQARAFECNREVVLNLSPTPDVLLSEPEIRQVLLNLTMNAIEASHEGSPIIIGSKRTHEEVLVTVTNKGEQIPPDIKARLGTPFFTTKDHGTGLGLAVSLNLAKLHKGTIDIDSEGDTTTFTLRLPIPN